eukprot:GHVS01101155.1.p1 GENE.GHVS01101155.1~~GHVS01101155.1.p1  ORF type:complete len:286 (-),score=23.66 GHVS01101155.1:88-945(-)
MAHRSSAAHFLLIAIAALLLFALNEVESGPTEEAEQCSLLHEVASRLGIKVDDLLYKPFVDTQNFNTVIFATYEDVGGIGVTVAELSDDGVVVESFPVIAPVLHILGNNDGALLMLTATNFFVFDFKLTDGLTHERCLMFSCSEKWDLPNKEDAKKLTQLMKFPSGCDDVQAAFEDLIVETKGRIQMNSPPMSDDDQAPFKDLDTQLTGKMENKGTVDDVESGFVQLLKYGNGNVYGYISHTREWEEVFCHDVRDAVDLSTIVVLRIERSKEVHGFYFINFVDST